MIGTARPPWRCGSFSGFWDSASEAEKVAAFSSRRLGQSLRFSHPSADCVTRSSTFVSFAPPMTAVLSEDVEEFESQARPPRFNQALGVDYRPACFPVLMTGHDILRS